MILNKLTITDFGTFAGCHELPLVPKPRRPIILFGGKNGAGKSTLSEALTLCLYGAGTRGTGSSREGYLKYLGTRIHSNPNALIQPTFASIGVEFLYCHAEGIATYNVERSWEVRAGKLSEHLTVQRNGKRLEEIEAGNWQAFIYELIPPGVSELFFFDGERIQQLAEDTTDQQSLADAIKSLLGLDIVERLETDLRIHLSRFNKPVGKSNRLREISDIRAEIARLRKQIDRCNQARLRQENVLKSLRAGITRAESELASQGGTFARGREDLIQRQASLKSRISYFEGTIRDLCAGMLPFAIASNLCLKLKDSLALEERSLHLRAGLALLSSAKKEIAERFEDEQLFSGLPGFVKPLIQARISSSFQKPLKVEEDSPGELFHDVSAANRIQLLSWISSATTDVPKTIRSITNDLEASYRELQQIEDHLRKIPSDEALKPLLEKIHGLNEELVRVGANALNKDDEISAMELRFGELERQYGQLAQKLAAQAKQSNQIQMLPRVQKVLDEYKQALLTKKVLQLQETVTDCFNLLCRKKDVLRRIRIDPNTFSVSLCDRQNRVLPKSHLSAGEKQIYAIAMLWALGKTSGRPLPIVIDTPLARLDSDHRRLLVQHYFPMASHQVIVLSTDTEVDQSYFDELRPAVTRAYHLDFDQVQSSTVIKPGYFWKDRNEAYKAAAN